MLAMTPVKTDRNSNCIELELEAEAANEEDRTHFSNVVRQLLLEPMGPINDGVDLVEKKMDDFFQKQKTMIGRISYVVLALGLLAYVIAASVIDFARARVLLILTVLGIISVSYSVIKVYFGKAINACIWKPVKTSCIDRFWFLWKWGCTILFLAFVLYWIIWDTAKNIERLMSLVGLFVYMLLAFLLSTNRRKIKWRPVLWGFALQFVLALIILRWDIGFQIFSWIGERFTILLGFAQEGTDFFFKDLKQFAFIIFPIIAYFSALMYLLWYFGITNVIVVKLGWLFQITLETTPAESVSAAGNIFLGMVIAPLMVRQFLEKMTESEIHCLMTGGFATVAGSALGTYIHVFKISASHLIAASVMSAPAALALSKIMCPETEEPAVKNVESIEIEKPKENNVFEAAAVGAAMSTGLIANIFVCLTAFLSIRGALNSFLGWLGMMVGEPRLSFEFICSYVFMPLAYIMGVSWDDAFQVGQLFGTKLFFNEFLAYMQLAVIVKKRAAGVPGMLSKRSEIIATYALCAFANIGSMGFTVGGLSALVPSKRQIFAKHVFRAMIAGTFASFMTACIAGLLYDEASTLTPEAPVFVSITPTINATMSSFVQ